MLSKKTMFKARVLRIVEAKDIRAGLDVKFIILFIYLFFGRGGGAEGLPKICLKAGVHVIC